MNFARKKRNNNWNIVDYSFVPANQQTSVLYCGLTDFSSPPHEDELAFLHSV